MASDIVVREATTEETQYASLDEAWGAAPLLQGQMRDRLRRVYERLLAEGALVEAIDPVTHTRHVYAAATIEIAQGAVVCGVS